MGLFTSLQLKSQNPETRRRAALKLGSPGRTSAIPALEALLEDDEWTVREAAVEALGEVAHEVAVAPVLAAVKGADRVRDAAGAAAIRAAAVKALGRIGTPAVPHLAEALRDRHAKLRECAIEALGVVGGPEAAAALAGSLADDRSSVRQAAVAAIVRASGPAAVTPLRAALAHKDPTTRRSAVEALATVRDRAAVEALRPLLADHDRGVRGQAVRSLAGIATPDAVDALVDALEAGDRDVRAEVSAALRTFDWTPRDARQRVIRAVTTGHLDEAVAEGAAAVDALVTTLADKEPSVRRGALAALAQLRDVRAATPATALLRDPDPAVRDAAVDTLAAIGPDAADALVDTLRDRAATVRAAAARALALIGEGRVAAVLIGRLGAGELTTHGTSELRVLNSREALDAAERAADGMAALQEHIGQRLPAGTLRAVASLADVLLLEPGRVPDSSDRIDLGDLRQAAKAELARR